MCHLTAVFKRLLTILLRMAAWEACLLAATTDGAVRVRDTRAINMCIDIHK